MVLRKMEIPIKDIIRIYESEDMRTVVEVFVKRIRSAPLASLQKRNRVV